MPATKPPSPAALIAASGRPLRQIAAAANLDVKTVLAAKHTNVWPKQYRTRTALMLALGLDPDAKAAS